MKIQTYEQRGVATSGTTKLSGGDPVAQAMQGLGGQIQNVGKVAFGIQQARNDLKAQGNVSDYNVAWMEEQNRIATKADQMVKGGDMSLEDSEGWVDGELEVWNESYIGNADYDEKTRATIQSHWNESSAAFKIKYNGAVQSRLDERHVVQVTTDADMLKKQALDLEASGQFDRAEVLAGQANEKYDSLAPYVGEEKVVAFKQAGNFSASQMAIRESMLVSDTEKLQKDIEENKAEYSASQYSSLLNQVSAREKQIRAGVGDQVVQLSSLADQGVDISTAIDEMEPLINDSFGDATLKALRDTNGQKQFLTNIKDSDQMEIALEDANEALKADFPSVSKLVEAVRFPLIVSTNGKKVDAAFKAINDSAMSPEYKFALIQDVFDDQEERAKERQVGWHSESFKLFGTTKRGRAFETLRLAYDEAVTATGNTDLYQTFPENWVELRDIVAKGEVAGGDNTLPIEQQVSAWIEQKTAPMTAAAASQAIEIGALRSMTGSRYTGFKQTRKIKEPNIRIWGQ